MRDTQAEDYDPRELAKGQTEAFKQKYSDGPVEQKRETVNVSINDEERVMLNELKRLFNTPQDSTALKLGAQVAVNVLHGTFGKDLLPWLFSSKRRKQD